MNTAPGHTRGQGRLLDRILAMPDLAHVVPRLKPQVLHRLIQHCGLEDCGPLMALATPDLLARVFDLDLWRPVTAGLTERFDADRFGLWLEVMLDTDVSHAVTTLAAMDTDLIATALARHVRVVELGAVSPYMTLEGHIAQGFTIDDPLRVEVGGFVLSGRRGEFWDAITTAVHALAETHGDSFNQIMHRCCRQSSSPPESDGPSDLLLARDQAMFDVDVARDARRETQGYVSPAEARAFLQVSRRLDRRQERMPPPDWTTRSFFRDTEAVRPLESGPLADERPSGRGEPAADTPDAAAVIVDLLNEAGLMPRAPRPLLEAGEAGGPGLARLRMQLQFAYDYDHEAFATRKAELAYLANTLVAGASIQSRAIAEEEAATAAMAICNLGLEKWPVHWLACDIRTGQAATVVAKALPEDYLVGHDLVRVFQVGWTVLHEDICVYAADKLVSILASLRCHDHDVQLAIEALRIRLVKDLRAGSPWDARAALDVIAFLDTPAWAALLGLIDQLPTLHAALGASLSGATHKIDVTAFEFISENRHVQQARAFVELLPALLRS